MDSGKAPIYAGFVAYFPNAMEEVAKVSRMGAQKYNLTYAEKNWLQVENGAERYRDALIRHTVEEAKGELNDPESQLAHAAHRAWNAMATLELLLRDQKPANEERGWVQLHSVVFSQEELASEIKDAETVWAEGHSNRAAVTRFEVHPDDTRVKGFGHWTVKRGARIRFV